MLDVLSFTHKFESYLLYTRRLIQIRKLRLWVFKQLARQLMINYRHLGNITNPKSLKGIWQINDHIWLLSWTAEDSLLSKVKLGEKKKDKACYRSFNSPIQTSLILLIIFWQSSRLCTIYTLFPERQQHIWSFQWSHLECHPYCSFHLAKSFRIHSSFISSIKTSLTILATITLMPTHHSFTTSRKPLCYF